MSDPTMQGTPPGTTAARYALSEIDAQGRKAARGAGCPWGLAEEAGKAARWLASHGEDGPAALAALLEARGGRCCRGGAPCDLRTGAERADAGAAPSQDVSPLIRAIIARAAGAPEGSPESRPVAPVVWAALDRLAARTYAPATDASRLAGAGAGTTDND